MRVSKRLYGAVLAGLLTCSMGVGPLALAVEGGSPLQGIAEGAAAAKAQAEAPAEEAPAPEAPSADASVEASVPSFNTVIQGPVSYQVLSDWDFVDESDEDLTWYYFENDDGMFECMVSDDCLIGSEDEFTAEYQAYIAEQLTDGLFGDVEDRYLDGVLIRDITYTAEQDGVSFRGAMTIVFGGDFTAVCDSIFYVGDGVDPSNEYGQVHRSITWASAGTGLPVPAGTSGTEASAPAFTSGTVMPGTPFACDGWTITVLDDPAGIQWVTAPDDFFLEQYQGAQMVAVPIELTNTTGATEDPFLLSVYTYNTSGVQQSDWPGIGFDDSIESIGSIRNGATVTCYLYAAYTGDGEYMFEFSDWENGSVEVPVNIAQ